MIHLFDHFIIKVDSVYDERPAESGLIKINHAFYIEKERDRFERKLLCGTVQAVPFGYSTGNYMPVDCGVPPYKLYIGHDAIQRQVNMGYKDWEDFQNYYHPGLKESFDFLSMEHYGRMIDAKVGEKVYFHPSVTEEENYMSPGVYRANGDKLICVVGDTIRPQAGYVLVEPHFDTQMEESGFIIRAESEVKLLEGTVRYARPGSDLVEGDFILHMEDANWEIIIEGVKYYAMKEDEVFLKKVMA